MKISQKNKNKMREASLPLNFCFKCQNTGKYKLVLHGMIDIETGKSPIILEKKCECGK